MPSYSQNCSNCTFNYNTGGVCLDGTVIIEDENNTVLHTVPVASGGSVTQEIADSNVAIIKIATFIIKLY